MLQVACASHTPLMAFTDPAGGREDVRAALRRLGERIEAFDPELVFQFSPDHYNGFFYDLMPPFCLGVKASGVGDWDTHSGPLEVPEQAALGAHAAATQAGIDLAISYRMVVDHGFTQFWQITVGAADRYPVVPIFINCAAPPLPQSATADEARREFLIAGRNPGAEARAARQERILAAGKASAKGEGPCLPLNPEWDERVLKILEDGKLDEFDHWDDQDVKRLGGSGAAEIRAWLAAFAALSSAGRYESKVELYRAIPEWIVGMGVMHAKSS